MWVAGVNKSTTRTNYMLAPGEACDSPILVRGRGRDKSIEFSRTIGGGGIGKKNREKKD